MEALFGGDGAAGGPVGQFPLEQWFLEMPPCTRYWTTATVLTAVLTQCKIVSPLQLYYSFRAVYAKSQYWRLLTTFTYFGPLSLDLVFHLFFLQRYSRLLETSLGSTPAQYSYLLLFACGSLLLLSTTSLFTTHLTTSLFSSFRSRPGPAISSGPALPFLGTSLSSTLVYIWSRRNPDTRLSLMGLLVFSAPWLPWVLMAFSFVVHGSVPKDEILGVVVGHVWYFFADVWPGIYDGQRPLDPPQWWIRLWDRNANTHPGHGLGLARPRPIDRPPPAQVAG